MSTNKNNRQWTEEDWQAVRDELRTLDRELSDDETIALYMKHGMTEKNARKALFRYQDFCGVTSEEWAQELAMMSPEDRLDHQIIAFIRRYLIRNEDQYPIADPLEIMGKRGGEADLRRFLSMGGSANSKSENGMSLAQHAARHGNLPLLKALVAEGASLENVLHAAIICGQENVLHYLVDELHLDVNEKNPEGLTPLQCAWNYPELKPYLVSRGAKYS